MRWSDLYIPTLRDDPADADAVSHRLLVRGGFIRQLMAGHYSLLPLAVRVRAKIIEIIRQEMNRIGAQEFILPAMHPAEIWQRTGRWDAMGDEMFRLKDRKGSDIALGMTHEEIFTTLSQELRSYRDLPQMWYQFQTKFRDEPRPRNGLIRVREFTMKDSYSFDIDAAGLDRSFDLHREAYERIFTRLDVPAISVQASSGSMGGSASVEFMCPAASGEDLVARCGSCGYGANIEKATSAVEPVLDAEGPGAPEPFDTPSAKTIDDLVAQHGVAGDRQIKTLVYVLDGQLTLVLMRGDHQLVEQKLLDGTGALSIRPAHAEEIRERLGASPGSLGAVGLNGLLVVADHALRGRRNMVTGANSDGIHLRGVDIDRDITVGRWLDLRQVVDGEQCPQCRSALEVVRAIEVGHIFKLGYRYTESLDVAVLGPDGTRVRPIMGSYGIGVERLIAAIVETHHDDLGIVWPVQTAPFEVSILLLNGDESSAPRTAEIIYDQLRGSRIEVILDDRPERPGVKFRDVELIGIPYRVTVGSRGLASGTVEVTDRASGETTPVALDEVAEYVRRLVHVPPDGMLPTG